MRRTISLLVMAWLTACAAAPRHEGSAQKASSTLVSMSGEGEFVEIERTADHSWVEVRRSPPGSVPAAMFALRGSCAVLRARGAQYLASERVDAAVPSYRLSFPKSATMAELNGPGKSVFSASDCAMLRF